MHDLANASSWGQLVSAVLIATLGGLVASIRPRTRPNLAFVAFAVAFGGQFALTNSGYLFLDYPALDAPAWFEAPRALLRLATAAGVVALAFVLPTPLRDAAQFVKGPPGCRLPDSTLPFGQHPRDSRSHIAFPIRYAFVTVPVESVFAAPSHHGAACGATLADLGDWDW